MTNASVRLGQTRHRGIDAALDENLAERGCCTRHDDRDASNMLPSHHVCDQANACRVDVSCGGTIEHKRLVSVTQGV